MQNTFLQHLEFHPKEHIKSIEIKGLVPEIAKIP